MSENKNAKSAKRFFNAAICPKILKPQSPVKKLRTEVEKALKIYSK